MVLRKRSVYHRILDSPTGSFFLFGPRGTGKSTWLRANLPAALFIDLLDEATYQSFLADPASFADQIRAVEPERVVVVDEVQRLPQLLNEVHRAIEERGQRFALCGSSARKLKSDGVNLLAGRAVRRAMHPFLPEELGADFSLDQALRFGLIPVVLGAPDPSEALEAYVQMYLKEEIQAEALVRNLPGFARFLPVAALFHAQVLNVSGLARDAGVARTTVNGYLEILEDTLVAFRLPAFEGKLRVRERRHPKLYWVDSGMVRGLKRNTGPIIPEESGHLLEGLVAGMLRAYRDYRNLFDEMYYWSPLEGRSTEVDFLLLRGAKRIALEVKSSSSRPRGNDLRGLRAIADLEGLERRLLIYRGKNRLLTDDGIEIVPFEFFCELLESGKL